MPKAPLLIKFYELGTIIILMFKYEEQKIY